LADGSESAERGGPNVWLGYDFGQPHDADNLTDWATISSLATAAGTLVLAVATFASVRSASRAARIAERALQAGLRPVLVPSRLEDPPERMMWIDGHWSEVCGGRASAELVDGIVYLAMSLRNVGSGMAVLHGWDPSPILLRTGDSHIAPGEFRLQSRDMYVAPGDTSFWQGAIRQPDDPVYPGISAAIEGRRAFSIDLLYGDHEGGQRTISRFALVAPDGDDAGWLCSVSRHWNIDRPDPR
jgi:hypothetical protein